MSASLLKHSKVCFQRAKLLFLYKRPDQRFSHRWELRSKSDYFQWNPPFSTCQLTMSLPLCPPWKSSPFWHNGGWMCIIAFTAIYSRRKEAHPTPTLLPPSVIFFSLKKNLGHMPQRNAKCFNSFAPFLSSCHLQGLSLCPEVICSGWTIKAIMVAACFPIMRRNDWQQRDSAEVEGHLASIYLIWKHFFFIGIHSSNKSQTNWSDYLLEILFFYLFCLNIQVFMWHFSITFLTFLGRALVCHS